LLETPATAIQVDAAVATMLPYVNPKKLSSVQEAMELLKASLEAEQVYNVDFELIKTAITRFASAYETLYYELGDKAGKSSEMYNLDCTPYLDAVNCRKQLTKLAGFVAELTGDARTAIEVLETFVSAYCRVQDALKSLKPKIIKGRKPAAPKPGAFVQTLGSKEAQDLVRAKMLAGVQKPLDEYETHVAEFFIKTAESLAELKHVSLQKVTPMQGVVLRLAFDMKRIDAKEHEIKLMPDYKAIFAKEAKRARDDIQASFLAKSVMKLSKLVDVKGNLESVDEARPGTASIHGGTGSISSAFVFKFADSSSFRVDSKIIVNYTAKGQPFNQFPTTFHDVKLPDGSKLAVPSEEKMLTKFAAAEVKA
jgi:hypothetical protein